MSHKPIGPAAHGAIAAASSLLRDYDAYEPRPPLPTGQRPFSATLTSAPQGPERAG